MTTQTDTTTTTSTEPEIRANLWAEHNGITADFAFVPFSLSRNASEKFPSLNWKVTLYKDKREILRFDYSQGSGHAPSYKQRMVAHDVRMVAHECERGYKASFYNSKKINSPKLADVLYSLAMDSDCLDYATFEDWASEFEYDKDSRKAEAIYQTCLEYGLKLRAAVGDKGLQSLRTAVQDM